MENITLYEAMAIIDEYLESKGDTLDRIYGKDIDKIQSLTKKKNTIDENIKKLDGKSKERAKALSHKVFQDKYNAEQELKKKLKKNIESNVPDYRKKNIDDIVEDKAFALRMRRSYPSQRLAYADRIKELKDFHGVGGHNAKDNKRESNIYLNMQKGMKESVNTKLHIYESYDAGIITEEEKNDFLDIINSFED